jgi:hypothetical protein
MLRARTGYAANNFAVLRRLALHLFRRDTRVKIGINSNNSRRDGT